MLRITYELKRVRYMRMLINGLLIIIFSPLLLLSYIGELSDKIITFISDSYSRFERKVARRFKLDDVARKQYEANPEKFKERRKK